MFWIAGALAEGSTRTLLWLIALAIDYGAPAVTYWVPGVGRVPPSAWDVSAAHFAERFQLFVIIALGESIVITGATTAELDLDTGRTAAFAVAFLGSAALWWLYFNYVAAIAERRLELAAEDRTLMARDAYTYLHVVMIAGRDRVGGRRRAGHRPPRGAPATAPSWRRWRRARPSTCWPTCCSACG